MQELSGEPEIVLVLFFQVEPELLHKSKRTGQHWSEQDDNWNENCDGQLQGSRTSCCVCGSRDPQERPAADGDDDWTASTQVGPTYELTPAQFTGSECITTSFVS